MRSTLEPLEGNKVKLSVELEESEFDRAIDTAFKKIAREVRIPGFRPGKAPRKVLEARFGADVARDQALRDSLPEFYVDAVREHEVDVIAAPEIEITAGQEEGPVAFDAVVEVRPRIEVPGYASLRVEVPSPQPSQDEIDAQVDRLREQFAELTEVDRPAAEGDVVTIALNGEEEGQPVPGLQADEYAYRVGAGSIAAELDDELTGAEVGAALAFDGELLGTGRTVTFSVLVKKVQERVLPEVTDDWASEVSEFETVQELRQDLADRMSGVRRFQVLRAVSDNTVRALVDLVTDDAPEPLVSREVQHQLENLAMRLSAQGISAEQYFAITGQSQEELVAQLREAAEQSVKADLALRAVAEAENIEVSDDDLDAEIERLAVQVREKPAKVRQRLERNDQLPALRSDIRTRKALDWLLEHVEVVDEEGQAVDVAALRAGADDEHDHDEHDGHDHHGHDHDHHGHDHDHDHDHDDDD